MTEGINGKCARWKMLRPRRNSIAATLMALSIVASAPAPARADDRGRVEGTFSMFYAYPSAVNYCADGSGDGNFSFQAQGLGNLQGLGAVFLTVKKCLTVSDWIYAGSFTMSAGNHTIYGTYDGTQGEFNEDGFSPFRGVLTITGGTGKFRNAKGRLTFEAVSGPDSVGAIASTFNGMAFYSVRGTVDTGE